MSLVHLPVGEVMRRDVKTIDGSRSLSECVSLMNTQNIESVVIVENVRPAGIFTERDLVRMMVLGCDSLKLSMTEVMTKPLKTILPSATIWDAIVTMESNAIRQLPVIDTNGNLVGM